MGTPTQRLPLPLALALLSCTEEPARAPQLLSVVPAQASADAPVELQLSGENFQPLVRTDFKNGKRSFIDSGFIVRLLPQDSPLPPAGEGQGDGGPSNAPVDLVDVHQTGPTTLLATVPAGIARGVYDVVVACPSGAQGVLPAGYRVVTSRESVVGFRFGAIGTQRRQVPFPLALTAVDSQGRTVDGFDGTVTLTDRTGTLSPTEAGPFVMGKARLLVAVSALSSADAITATDALGHSSTSEELEVRRGLAAAVAFTDPGQTLVFGECGVAELALRDAFGLDAEAAEAVEVELLSSPPGALELTSDCSNPLTRVYLPADGTPAGFAFIGRKAGRATIRAAPVGLPSVSQEYLVLPGPIVQLVLASAAQRVKVGECSGPVRVEAQDVNGDATATPGDIAVTLAAEPQGAVSFHSDGQCTSGLGQFRITAGNSSAVLFFRGSVPGEVTVRVSAQGYASNSQIEDITP